ncbi:hypothetical protein [Roseateles flavus]|uniref:PNPLA domain-containing protein n=1 Tax=Roseateles flavus TaxID=3149041 RepID=A0ABV0GGK7_9BURK
MGKAAADIDVIAAPAASLSTGTRPRFRTGTRLLFMLYVCRVPLLAGLIVLAAGALADQVQEVVRVYVLNADDPEGGNGVWLKLGAIYAGLFLLSWTQLFWSRYALVNRYPSPLANNAVLRAALRLLPSFLALLPWVGGAVAMAKAGSGLSGSPQALAQFMSWVLVMLGLGAVFTYYSKRRRATIRHQAANASLTAKPNGARIGRVVFAQGDWLTVSLGLGFVLFVAAAVAPQQLGGWLGAIAVLLAACVALVPALTWLTASPWVPRWHWLTLLFLVAALWSWLDLNDNHELRQLARVEKGVKSPGYGGAFREWLSTRVQPGNVDPYPVVFVAAEGGGIRAAYFTAQVLAAIQDRCPAFARHLFVVSGVSGGSVGAATFAGLLDASAEADAKDDLGCAGEIGDRGHYADRAEAVLKADYLGPLVATLLFPDALQRLLPFSVPAWDRARTLEETVERSFKAELKSDFMERGLYTYWRPERNVPILMFNATSVETGHRTVASPVYPIEERFHRLTTFFDFAPFTEYRISTMAVTSARFPLVTPAAALTNGDSKQRFVDGGYFENSGAATLSEAVDVAMQMAALYKIAIRPVVIRIGNSPSMLAATENKKATQEAQEEQKPSMGLGELLSPVRTMANTRTARGVLAAEALKTNITTMQDNGVLSDYVEFQIGVDAIPIPLGWQLASTTRNALVAQLKRPADCGTRSGIVNGCSVQDVVDIIRSAQRRLRHRLPRRQHRPRPLPRPCARDRCRSFPLRHRCNGASGRT